MLVQFYDSCIWLFIIYFLSCCSCFVFKTILLKYRNIVEECLNIALKFLSLTPPNLERALETTGEKKAKGRSTSFRKVVGVDFKVNSCLYAVTKREKKLCLCS